MCCNNTNFHVKDDKNNLDISKNELTRTQPDRKNTACIMDGVVANGKMLPVKNKGIIEKHMKDNSLRINTSIKNVSIEQNERIKRLNEISNRSKILILKVKMLS